MLRFELTTFGHESPLDQGCRQELFIFKTHFSVRSHFVRKLLLWALNPGPSSCKQLSYHRSHTLYQAYAPIPDIDPCEPLFKRCSFSKNVNPYFSAFSRVWLKVEIIRTCSKKWYGGHQIKCKTWTLPDQHLSLFLSQSSTLTHTRRITRTHKLPLISAGIFFTHILSLLFL